ncbi:hypothetical protein JCM8547_005567 [Rhodosporidiobolus lusitaniae]
MPAQKRTAASKTPLQGSWTPSPSPSPPASPFAPLPLDLSDAERFQLLEEHGPIKPSQLGLSSGVKGGMGKGKGKEPLVVVSPEELEKMVQQQQEGAAEEEEEVQEEEEEAMLWEEVANAVLWTVPFGFLFSGMDYAVHAQFGQRLVPSEEFSRVLNMLPILLLLNFLVLRPPSRRLLPHQLTQLLMFALSVFSGLSLIHTTTTAGYLQVMAHAPSLGALWCWTVVQMELPWALAALVGVAVGVTVRGEHGSLKWWV